MQVSSSGSQPEFRSYNSGGGFPIGGFGFFPGRRLLRAAQQ
jgi:hypothetical protein